MDGRQADLLGRITKDIGDARKVGDALRNVTRAAKKFGMAVGRFSSKAPNLGNQLEVRGHGPSRKPRLHKGSQRTCHICNPESYAYWRRFEEKMKKAKGGR